MKTPEQTVRLSSMVRPDGVKGLAYRIAAAMIKEHGAYFCTMDGKRTKVVA